jgi:shikimate kinase
MPGSPQFLARPIVLVGMMGAGKTSVGRALAERLGLPFADADEEIEREAGLSLPEIFDREGEAAFRWRERQEMRRLIAAAPSVIAAGGGAFLAAELREAVLDRCTAIWLKAEPELLAERLAGSHPRPLLEGKDARMELERLAAAREPAYACAHLHICARREPLAATVDRVLEALLGQSS